MSDLATILKENPGATLLLDTDTFWVVKDMKAGGDEVHWSDVEGNELYEGHGSCRDLVYIMAGLLKLKVELV